MSINDFNYPLLIRQAQALFDGERNFLANCANLSALLFAHLPDLNWAGVYLIDSNELVVGPFQGQPACTRIALGAGVCGTAAQSREVQIVKNVHEFDGHIACDSASNSEIVLPMIKDGVLVGVLDLDSPSFDRFNEHDADGLRQMVVHLMVASDI